MADTNERAVDDDASDGRLPACYQCGGWFLRVRMAPVRLETGREVAWRSRLYRCANPRCGVTMCYPDPS